MHTFLSALRYEVGEMHMALRLIPALFSLMALSAHAVPLATEAPPPSPSISMPMWQPTPLGGGLPGLNIESISAAGSLQKGQWKQAFESATAVLANGSPDPDALGIFAMAAAVLGDGRAAGSAITKLQKIEQKPYYGAMAQAILDLNSGATGKAEQAFSAVLGSHPGDPVALYYRGEILHMRGKDVEALRMLKEALARWPDFAPALGATAQLQSRQGAHKQAIAMMERAAAMDPENSAYRKGLAEVYDRAGQHDRARKIYADLLRKVPGVKEVYLRRAWGLMQAGSGHEALTSVDEAFRQFGPQPLGHLIKAMAQIDLRQIGAAKGSLNAYLDGNAKGAEAHYGAGLCYLAMGDSSQARKQFSEALARQQQYVQASTNLVVVEQAASQQRQSKAEISKARSAGEDPGLLSFLGANIALGSGDTAAYRSGLVTATSIVPSAQAFQWSGATLSPAQRQSLAVARNVMVLMFMNGWYGQAIQHADRALSVSPTDPVSLYFRGLALLAQGKPEKALDSLQHAARQEPGFYGAHMALASIHVAQKHLQSALAAYQTTISISPTFAPAYVGKAAVLLGLKRNKDALVALQQAEQHAKDGQTLYQLALLNERVGNKAKSRDLLRKSLETNNSGRWRGDAKKLLSQ